MPSSSSIFDITLTNWGPLATSSFTPPVACATISTVEVYETAVPDLRWTDCNPQREILCDAPEPTDASAYEEYWAVNSVLGGSQIGAYYSPAPECPAGYKTVGVAARNGQRISRSGFLAGPTQTPVEVPSSLIPSVFPTTPGVTPTPVPELDEANFPVFYGADDALIALLDPSETAVWCCPSAMTAGFDGYCSSALPSYTFSSICNTFITEGDIATYTTGIPNDSGRTTEGLIGIITATTQSVLTTTIAPEQATDFVAFSVVPPLTLVHKPTDLVSGEQAEFTGAAGRVTVGFGLGSGNIWGGVVGTLVASVVAGVSVVLLR
ncbi:hypothetical protein BJY04DRAFT_213455 [Aspergillus karnatakaensis]|uniref:uncharacterized protein n=1 Tax=Aspergillus karnatakaensis TaxID=1810916 RepID=UPI003CCDEE29